MKRTSKVVISVILSVLMLMAYLPTMAFAETSGYYTYSLDEDGNAEITSFDENASGDITIPAAIDGHPVTTINEFAFWFCDLLTSVTIPDSVTLIGDGTFSCCSSLKSVYVDENNNAYSSQDGVLFNKSKTEISFYPEGKTETSYIIPDSVTMIRDETFGNCGILKDITIGNNVTSIGYSSFVNCTSLTSITIPDSVTIIGDYAFEGCRALTNIIIGDGVTSIGGFAFEGCRNVKSLTMGNSVTSIGDFAFCTCFQLSDVYYNGTKEQWDSITLGAYNTLLNSASVHCWTNWVVTTPATCTTKGVETRTCTACDDTQTREIPATGHNYGSWTVTLEPTCTLEGQKQCVCAGCGDVITETIEKINHVDADDDGKCDGCGQNISSESGKGSIDDFRCKMCERYEELKDMPIIGQIITIVHFFIHSIAYISNLV